MNNNQISLTSEPINITMLGNPSRRVLLVEADDDRRRFNIEVLSDHGYRVDAVDDGVPAWAALTAKSYELLITEQDLPNMSGVELLKKLHGARMTLPVIMTTAFLPSWEFMRYPWIRPAATLLKPCTAAELLDTVQAVLRVLGAFHNPHATNRTAAKLAELSIK